MRCDNRLFKRRQEQRSTLGPYRADLAMPSQQSNASIHEPMQIDSSRIQRLTQEEKDRRRKEDLYMYYGGLGHQTRNCQKKLSFDIKAIQVPVHYNKFKARDGSSRLGKR